MGKETITCKQLGNYHAFDLEKELLKLKRLKGILQKMPDNKQKYLLLSNYRLYYQFLQNLYSANNFPFKVYNFDWETITNKYIRMPYEASFQLEEHSDLINEIFKDVRKINEQHGIYKDYNLDKKINPKLGLELLEEFFNGLPSNINKLFKEVMNGNIYFVSPTDNSYAYDVTCYDKPKIKCSESLNSYDAYYIIAHEMGHCYHFNLLYGRDFYFMLDRETPSIFMEIIFDRFVDKYLYNQDYGITNLFNRQGLFASLNALGNVILTSGNEYYYIDDEIDVSLKSDLITKEDVKYLKEWGCYKNKMLEEKECIRKVFVDWFKYPLSNLFAIYFADIYSSDPKEGLRLLRDFISLPPSVTIEEKIKMYDITGDSYKKMIKDVHEFGKRKHLL